MMTRISLLIAYVLSLAGCADFPGRCELGIAHHDCLPGEASYREFPSDDATCRAYGLKPGTHDYEICRAAKYQVEEEAKTAINAGWWKNPL
ncbi:MAG TPA: hypothetical protein VEQ35_08455 [Beijerinckia sp.]|jgi:hypothetical protein|nr:hypothetical protein [Beijerinckia sp.]